MVRIHIMENIFIWVGWALVFNENKQFGKDSLYTYFVTINTMTLTMNMIY